MYTVVQEFFGGEELAALGREVEAGRSDAAPMYIPEQTIVQGYLNPPARFSWSAAGARLDELQGSDRLTAALTAHAPSAAALRPRHSSYNRYAVGDHIGVHYDIDTCSLTVLVALTPGIADLQTYPELAGLDAEALHERVRSGRLGDQVPLRLPFGGLVILEGGALPHARLPVEDECCVATMCFG